MHRLVNHIDHPCFQERGQDVWHIWFWHCYWRADCDWAIETHHARGAKRLSACLWIDLFRTAAIARYAANHLGKLTLIGQMFNFEVIDRRLRLMYDWLNQDRDKLIALLEVGYGTRNPDHNR